MRGQRSNEATQPFLRWKRAQHRLDDHTPGPAPQPTFRLSRLRSCLPSWFFLNKFWVLEALSSTCSITLFATIIVVLHIYDGKAYGTASAVSQGNQIKRPGIYPILSFLSAILRACMLLPVATAIGQLKWSWFRDKRKLIDLERFDEASRGMIGSLVLFCTVGIKHWVTLGAVLMIATLPIDALIQNAVLMPQRREENTVPYYRANLTVTNATSLPKMIKYYGWQTMVSSRNPWATSPMINAAKFGMSYLTGLIDSYTAIDNVACPTGYCQFGRYQALGVDYNCTVRSVEFVSGQGWYPYWTIPGTDLRLYEHGTDQYEAMVLATKSYASPSNSTTIDGALKLDNIPLLVRTALLVGTWNGPPVGIECALYWNVFTFSGHIDQTISSYLNQTFIDVPVSMRDHEISKDRFTLQPKECWVNNRLVLHDETDLWQRECNFTVGADAHHGIQSLLLDPTDGLMGDSRLIFENTTTHEKEWSPMNQFVSNIHGLVDQRSGDRVEFLIDDIFTTFSNIAVVMSDVLRGSETRRSDSQSSRTIGTVYHHVFYYKIAWLRLLPPAVLVVSCAVFVLCTAITTKGECDWRRSNLPLLFHGLADRDKELYTEIRSLPDMEKAAAHMHVRLVNMGDGKNLLTGAEYWPDP